MMKIKHRAPCVKAVLKDGETYHYVLIGGVYYYNGRSRFLLEKATETGFWKDNISKITQNARIGDFKELKDFIEYQSPKAKIVKYIRCWES
ncbi:hypothetical protein HOT32_gp24 [Erwinia phage Faunus]|uniref:Uncharacterized protein n=1 Tax=Erwinia phage Faunus TaxID=2182346 RepID=A0A2U8UWW2_9CAUD|nr:hypothetical protein HOT32_gp24 [Erwinia phage Faunus]AWN08607.1 hypothetical protein [Erwinia phage Faunus]